MVGQDEVNHILFDFNAVVDTDIGIAMLINKKFRNPAYVNQKMLDKSMNDYKYLLVNRKYYNPLIGFLLPEQWDSAPELYSEFMTTKDNFGDVLKGSPTTSLMELAQESNLKENTSCDVTILCWNELQEEYISTYDKTLRIHRKGEDDKAVSVKNYDTLVLKFPYPVTEFTDSEDTNTIEMIRGKNIYICRYRFNVLPNNSEHLNLTDDVKLYAAAPNQFYICDIYGNAKLTDVKEEISNV